MAAVAYGIERTPAQPMEETRWTDPTVEADVSPYVLSKLYAEQAAWDYVRETVGAPELVTVNPCAVLGPLLADNPSESLLLVTKMLRGDFPGVPKFGMEIVDVRDVADLHVLALETPQAAGERFLAAAGHRTLGQVARVVKQTAPAYGRKMPKMELPDLAVRFFRSLRQGDARRAQRIGQDARGHEPQGPGPA